LVVDGQPQGPYEDLGTATGYPFSADGKHLAYVILKDKKLHVVRDGQLGPPSDDVGDVVFSPDGSQMASAAKEKGKWRVSIDGRSQPPYDAIGEGSLLFSPDGSRLAYTARSGKQWMLVVDGKPGKPYDSIGQVLFSPDGRSLACKVRAAGTQMVVHDGREGRIFNRVGDGTLVFSPNSQRLAYVAMVSHKDSCVVVDEKRRHRYDFAGYLTFTPDNRAPVYAADNGKKAFTVVDEGEAVRQYDGIWNVRGEKLIFDSPKKFHYLGVREGKIYLVEEETE
jgi:WD40 repeat protein